MSIDIILQMCYYIYVMSGKQYIQKGKKIMTHTLTKSEMIEKLNEIDYYKNNEKMRKWLKTLDRDNLEFECERNGIEVYIQSTTTKTFDYLIGYDFGEYVLVDIAMLGSRKQYIMKSNTDNTEQVMTYKQFKKAIKGCDYPKR